MICPCLLKSIDQLVKTVSYFIRIMDDLSTMVIYQFLKPAPTINRCVHRLDNRKVKLTEKIHAVAFIVLLVTSAVFIAAPAFTPKASAAVTGTLTLSHSKLYGNSTLRILISDSDINLASSQFSSLKLTITASGANPGAAKSLNATQLSDGSWVAHIANMSCSSLCASNNGTIGHNNYVLGLNRTTNVNFGTATGSVVRTATAIRVGSGGNQVVKVNNTDALAYVLNNLKSATGRVAGKNYIENPGTMASRYINSTLLNPVIQLFNFTRLDTLSITYTDSTGSSGGSVEVTQSITYEYTTGSATNDRTSIPASAILRPVITDIDKNRDPTRADSFTVSNNSHAGGRTGSFKESGSVWFVITSTNTTGSISGTIAKRNGTGTGVQLTFTETGLNTNAFELNTTAGFNLNNSFLIRSGTFLPRAVKDGDLVRIVFSDIEASTALAATTTFGVTSTVSRKIGSISLSTSSAAISSDITVTITDLDANNNTKAKDRFVALVRLNTTAGSLGSASMARVTAWETDTNSSTFQFVIRPTLSNTTRISVSSTAPNNTQINGRVTGSVRPGDSATWYVTYNDNFTGVITVANATASLAWSTGTSISLDKTSYGSSDLEAKVTLTEPNANDSTAAQETLSFNSTKRTSVENSTVRFSGTVKIGNFALVVINGTNGGQGIRNFTALAIETSASSGVWTVTINLATLRAQPNGLTSTDQLRVSYTSKFTSTTYNSTATIGGTLATINFNRAEFPIAPNRRANMTINVVDTDLNQNPSAQETLTLRLFIRNATDGVVGNRIASGPAAAPSGDIRRLSWFNVSLTETGPNTGDFSVKILVNWNSSSVGMARLANYSHPTKALFNLDRNSDLVGGRIQACVTDGLGPTTLEASQAGTVASAKGVCKSINFAVHGATISTNVTSAKIGTAIKVTLTEQDLDSDVGEKDTVQIRFAITKGTAAPSEDTTPDLNVTLTLTETSASSGVFTNSSTLGTGVNPFSQVNASNHVRFRYQDDAAPGSTASAGLAKAKITTTVVVGSSTGTLTTIPTSETGPYNVLVVTLVDPDLAFNRTGTLGTDSTGRVVLHSVRSEQTNDVINNVLAKEMDRTIGKFKFNITISYSATAVTTDQTLQVNATDKIHLFYNDRLDNAGEVKVVEKIITVTTKDGVLATDKANYLVGEVITITLTDIDANRDSGVRNTTTVTVTTNSWTAGTDITLLEVAADSGVFTGQVTIVSTLPSAGQVLGAVGDVITIKYIDAFGSGAVKKTILFTARVGTSLPRTQQVPASAPAVVNAQGQPLTTVRMGDVATIQATVRNNDTTAHTFTYLVQVKNAQGVVVSLAWLRDISLAAGASTSPGLAWIPSTTGTYTVEVFVWESLTNAVALSPVQRITVTVG